MVSMMEFQSDHKKAAVFKAHHCTVSCCVIFSLTPRCKNGYCLGTTVVVHCNSTEEKREGREKQSLIDLSV